MSSSSSASPVESRYEFSNNISSPHNESSILSQDLPDLSQDTSGPGSEKHPKGKRKRTALVDTQQHHNTHDRTN